MGPLIGAPALFAFGDLCSRYQWIRACQGALNGAAEGAAGYLVACS